MPAVSNAGEKMLDKGAGLLYALFIELYSVNDIWYLHRPDCQAGCTAGQKGATAKESGIVKLEIGNFHVSDIRFGPETSYAKGLLTVNKEEAIAYLNANGGLKNIELHVARPGEYMRILPVKECVEPRFRPDGGSIFPGYLGPVRPCGAGTVYAMKGMSVVMCGKYGGWAEGMLDMAGPGAEYSLFSHLVNLVVVAENADPGEDGLHHKKNTAYRHAAHRLAEYLGKALAGQEPEGWERFELEGEGEKAPAALPRVALVAPIINQATGGYNDVLYGRDSVNMLPTLFHPNELLDGAVVSNSFCPKGINWSTYDWQNLPLIKRLYEEHGKTLEFAGVILAPSEESDERKIQNRVRVGELAQLLRCDGALLVEWGGGNMDVDFFYCFAELEDRGIATVGLLSEHAGHDGRSQSKVLLDEKADAIVCAANAAHLAELPPMERVLGDIQCLVRDNFPGAWAENRTLGPSLREDGSVLVDIQTIVGADGTAGWSRRTVKDF